MGVYTKAAAFEVGGVSEDPFVFRGEVEVASESDLLVEEGRCGGGESVCGHQVLEFTRFTICNKLFNSAFSEQLGSGGFLTAKGVFGAVKFWWTVLEKKQDRQDGKRFSRGG